ncbi:MAG: type I polyketide synthase, partial [Myxococcota bacterium]
MAQAPPTPQTSATTGTEIAVVGMAGRFPGAPDLARFWDNLAHARESITRLDEATLRARGVTEALLRNPAYVPATGELDEADGFDAAFFGVSPREAEILDPQQRAFLECAWTALEDAACDPERFAGPIGVFGSAGMNGYLLNLYANADIRRNVSPYELFVANDKDFLASRVSYKLNLRGPSLTVQTACSSSLVAVHLACQSLLAGECDLALAGGAAITRQVGYLALEGGIQSPDGHCRAFDAAAAGTVGGNGVGVVALKRLEDCTPEDRIDAIVRGSAINNDGGLKVSYTAPQVDQQAAVIREALAVADVGADSISCLEAHGTGTAMGDPIEVAALTHAFRHDTDRTQFCALGSLKTNIGHLDAAAGIAGFIKTVLALKHERIPASLHFETPNPQIDFDASPFFVNAKTRDWPRGASPRRAGVSSFGIGGTNAHVVLEEAPARDTASAADGPRVLSLSARSKSALDAQRGRLAARLEDDAAPSLRDAALTLREGRARMPWRLSVAATDRVTACLRLRAARLPARAVPPNPSIVFLFPGQGSQRKGMARALYDAEPVFARALDDLLDAFADTIEVDLRALLLDANAPGDLEATANAQPALFAVEVALARCLMEHGVQPTALLGHSLGELSAACVAGVLDPTAAARLVAQRGRCMQAAAPGAMLAVPLSPEALAPRLGDGLELAAHNAPELSVVSGPEAAIAAFDAALRTEGLATRRLHTSHAFHSAAMDEAVGPFVATVAAQPLAAPTTPFVSCVTGDWIHDEEATAPDYWGR